MGWRWRRSINLGGGARTTTTSRGMGLSWGIAGFRIGRSPAGSLWVSFTVPGTGISFFKYLGPQSQQAAAQQQQPVSALAPAPALPQNPPIAMTPNQRILDEIHRSKP